MEYEKRKGNPDIDLPHKKRIDELKDEAQDETKMKRQREMGKKENKEKNISQTNRPKYKFGHYKYRLSSDYNPDTP